MEDTQRVVRAAPKHHDEVMPQQQESQSVYMVGNMQILRDTKYVCHCPSPHGQLLQQHCGVSVMVMQAVSRMVLLNLGNAMCMICSDLNAQKNTD